MGTSFNKIQFDTQQHQKQNLNIFSISLIEDIAK